MCNNENSPKKQLSKEIKNLLKGNALKYERYKDNLESISHIEIARYQTEVVEAFDRLNANSFSNTVKSTNVDGYINAHKRSSQLMILFVDGQPYDNLDQLTRQIAAHNVMLVSSDNNDSKLLPGLLNLQFRAVHDYLHYLLQQEFDFVGEYKVYQAQKHMHKSKIRKQILYSEVVLQAAYCEYFGRFADTQKVVL